MRTREQEVEPLINLSEITEVELLILKRMREFTIGEHSSMWTGVMVGGGGGVTVAPPALVVPPAFGLPPELGGRLRFGSKSPPAPRVVPDAPPPLGP